MRVEGRPSETATTPCATVKLPSYGPFDWAIYADGQQLADYSFVLNGPQPTLSSGTLPKERTASGWLVYEIPPQGRIVLSYEPNFEGPPVYEITVRFE